MVDIHCHILPMVDDGSNTIETSLAMLDAAYHDGSDAFILTPHYACEYDFDNPKEKVMTLFEEFKESLESLRGEVREIKEAQTNSKVERDIASLVTMSNINFEYCQSLSKVIGSIGEALSNVPTVDSGTIDSALEKHKDEEQALVRRIYKISY